MKKKSVYDKINAEKTKENSKSYKDCYVKAMFSQRVLAFLIDAILVSIISFFITMFVPVNDTAKKLYEEQNRVLEGYVDGSLSMEDYANQLVDLGYDISKQTVITSIVSIVIALIYYVVYPCYNNGQTLGKMFMKIRIRKVNDKELSMNDLLVRALINNSIFVDIVSIILVLSLNKSMYLISSSFFTVFQYLVLIISLLFIAFTRKSQGLHDLVCNTEVVMTNTVKEDVLCESES